MAAESGAREHVVPLILVFIMDRMGVHTAKLLDCGSQRGLLHLAGMKCGSVSQEQVCGAALIGSMMCAGFR